MEDVRLPRWRISVEGGCKMDSLSCVQAFPGDSVAPGFEATGSRNGPSYPAD
jgi:hypothetical protein